LLLSRCSELKGRYEESEGVLRDGPANLPQGQPSGGGQPRSDFEEERVALFLGWSLRLVRAGELGEATEKLRSIERSIQELADSGGPGLLTAQCERRTLELAIAAARGELPHTEALRRMRAESRIYSEVADDSSPTWNLIAVCLALQLLEEGAEALDEADALLVAARDDWTLRDVISDALEQLHTQRAAANPDPKL